MADSLWDRIKSFAHDHAPERVQEWLWERQMVRQATEEYALHKERVAAGFYDGQADVHPFIRADEHLEAITAAARAGIADAEMEAANERAIAEDIASYEEARKPFVEVFGRDDKGRLHRDPHEGPAQVTTRYEDWGDGMGSREREELYVVHGEVIAVAKSRSAEDEETHSYEERWYDKDGKLHSFNGNPSEIVRKNHGIPEETYLDRSDVNFHEHGTLTNSIDRSYEDILAHKPIQVRNAFGVDLPGEEPGTIVPMPEFPARFPDANVEIAKQHVREYLSERGVEAGQLTDAQLGEFLGRTSPDLYDEVLAAKRDATDGFEIREDRSSEILRLYTEAIKGQQTYVQPVISTPMDIEGYRQEQAFYNKHQGDLEPMTIRASVAHNLNRAAEARRSGDLEGAREYVENAHQDRVVYNQPELGLSR